MTNAQKARFKTALEMKRQDVVRGIHAHTAELTIGDDEHDPLDQVKSISQRDEAVTLIRALSGTLSEVDLSLRGVLEGSYGICIECGEEIGLKRLEAIPWACHCIRCKEALESQERDEHASRAFIYRD